MNYRHYHYVGPPEILKASRLQPAGTRIGNPGALKEWLDSEPTEYTEYETWIATFVIGLDGDLYLAPRRSEHVACASGGPVLSAGEITINNDLVVVEITNQSTGFCPEPESWQAVAAALDRIGLEHPGRFTTEMLFRLCPSCDEINIVKDSWFVCVLCNGILPETWNFQ